MLPSLSSLSPPGLPARAGRPLPWWAVLASLIPLGCATARAQPSPVPGGTLDTVEVTGPGGVGGAYRATEASGARTELPLRELPQSVRVLTRDAIDDLGAQRLDDVLDYAGGITRQNSFGGLWDNVAIRGLAGNENTGMAMLLNGFASNRGFNAPRDLAGVERVEFLKGPAAALYGSSEPGGILNIVSKRPLWRGRHALDAIAGSDGLRRAAYDGSGVIGADFAWRLNLAAEERDSFRDHVHSQRRVVAPAFTWRLGSATVLEYTGEWLRHAAPLDRGVVAVSNRLDAIPRSRFLGEPADGDMAARNESHQLVLSHDWSADWRGRVGLSSRETALRGYSTEASALRADAWLTRQRRYRDWRSDDLSLQAELSGRLHTGAVAHEILAGVEGYRFDMDTLMLRANPSTARPYGIDIYAPWYGQPQPVPGPNTDTDEHQRGTAFYVQDTMRLGPQWRLMVGARHDRVHQSLADRLTRGVARQSPSATSPRIGLSWLPSPQWSVYANAGESFRPNAGSDASARAFAPERGRSVELGTKWDSEDGRLGASAALFQIHKRDVLTADPVNAGFSTAAGEVRSRGLEFELGGQLGRHWRVQAALALTDAQVTRDRTLEVGGRLLNVPRIAGSVLAMYEDALADGSRWGVGAGLSHVGRRLGQARTQAEALAGTPAFELPGYTTVRLSAHWQITPALRLRADIDNLFDKTCYASSYSRLWVAPGAGRSLTLALQARF